MSLLVYVELSESILYYIFINSPLNSEFLVLIRYILLNIIVVPGVVN